MSNKVIIFEGVDGVGKTLCATTAAAHLKRTQGNVMMFREPGGDPISEKIRDLILKNAAALDDYSLLMLFQAARENLWNAKINPSNEYNHIVLDRSILSTLVHQGLESTDGGTLKLVLEIYNSFVARYLEGKEVVVVLLEDDPKAIASRLNERGQLNALDAVDAATIAKRQASYNQSLNVLPREVTVYTLPVVAGNISATRNAVVNLMDSIFE